MSEFKRELGININTSVNTKKMQEAERIINAFIDKYDGESIRLGIDQTQVKADAREFTKTILGIKDLMEEVNSVKTNSPKMLPSIQQEVDNLEYAKQRFESVFAMFNDGSVVKGIDNIIDKISDGFSVTLVDLGERVSYLRNQIVDIKEAINVRSLEEYGDNSINYSSGDMNKRQLEERIELVQKLLQYQEELETFNGEKFSVDNSPTDQDTEWLGRNLETLQSYLTQLEKYNLKTTEQIKRRQELINQAKNDEQWNKEEHDNAKDNVKNDQIYEKSIESLERYIQERKDVIQKLIDNEDELFSVDGITKYINNANAQIERFEKQKKELQDLRNNKTESTDTPIVSNLTEVIEVLEKIERAVKDVTAAFKPLTDALASEDSALSAMVKSNISDLELLNLKVKEAFDNIEKLSNKQFNVTNVISSGSTSQNDLEQIRQFRQEAKEAYKQVEELYNEHKETANKIRSMPGGMDEILNFANLMSEFDLTDLGKRIKSRSAASLGIVIDELNEWKKVLLQFNSLRNNVEAGSFNISKYNDTSSKVKIGSKTTDKDDQSLVEKNKIDNTDILNDVRQLSEQIQNEFNSIRLKIEETFNFETLNPNIENIKSITAQIYQQFVDLQSNISKIEFKLNLPQIVNNNKTESDIIDKTSDAMQNEGDAAQDAVPKKNAFNEANKRVAEGMKETGDAGKVAAEGIKAETQAIREYDKVATTVDSEGTPLYQNRTQSGIHQDAVTTVKETYTWNADDNDWDLTTKQFIRDYKAYEKLEKDAQKRIQKVQAALKNYMSQFDNKTAGKWSNTGIYSELKAISTNGIGSVDDIDKVLNKMQLLDAEYNNVVMSFRKGTKSMNPFVNAFNSMDEMSEKVRQVQLSFNELKFPEDTLKEQVGELPGLLEKLQTALKPDKNGVINIVKVAEAYGNLNAAIKNVNTSISTQRQADSAQNKQLQELNDLYNQQAESFAKIREYKFKLQSDDIGEAESKRLQEKIEQEQINIKNIQKQVMSYGELHNRSVQLAAIDKQRKIILEEIADLAARNVDNETKKAQKDAEKARESANKEAQKVAKQNQKDLGTDASNAYDEYTQAVLKLKKLQTDTSGKDHTNDIKTTIKDIQDAKEKLSKLGIDVNKIAENTVLTEKQTNDLLEKRIAYKKELQHIDSQTADKVATANQKESQKYGKTIYNREARYKDIIDANLRSVGEQNISNDFLEKIEKYKQAYKEFERLRNQIANSTDVSDGLKGQFQDATLEVETLRKEILGVFKDIQNLDIPKGSTLLGSKQFEQGQIKDTRLALVEYANEITNSQIKITGFNAAGTELYGTLNKGNGVVENVTVSLKEASNQIIAFANGSKQVSTTWNQITNSVNNGIKRLAVMYLSFYDIIRYVRKGISYVKEIDLALTELKKVTDETESSYNRFLKTASEASSKIGSTVSDFTDATAAFARLGYSIDEAASMAETAIIYKNVADGLDSVEESSESIISTMMAFGIQANDTLSIVDKFNAVGNSFAITSAGIGDALQRSASALYSAGNDIDESVALVTAANSVVNFVPRRYSNIVTSR